MNKIRIASRTSDLAMTQTRDVIARLQDISPVTEFEIIPVVTKGDKILDVTLSKVGGKGLFVSEIEATLVRGEADIAVHSLKDVPAVLADGLELTAYPQRVDPRDALVSKAGQTLENLPEGARVGTSSLRRVAQVLHARPDLTVQSVRGNINTRLRKLDEGQFDAIVLAAAGLQRMGWEDRVTEYLDPWVCLPAVGQGILGIESRSDDTRLTELLQQLTDDSTKRAAMAERTLLHSLNGSCQVPIGGYAVVQEDGTLWLRGVVASPDGRTVLTADGESNSPIDLGKTVAAKLRELGATSLLAEVARENER